MISSIRNTLKAVKLNDKLNINNFGYKNIKCDIIRKLTYNFKNYSNFNFLIKNECSLLSINKNSSLYNNSDINKKFCNLKDFSSFSNSNQKLKKSFSYISKFNFSIKNSDENSHEHDHDIDNDSFGNREDYDGELTSKSKFNGQILTLNKKKPYERKKEESKENSVNIADNENNNSSDLLKVKSDKKNTNLIYSQKSNRNNKTVLNDYNNTDYMSEGFDSDQNMYNSNTSNKNSKTSKSNNINSEDNRNRTNSANNSKNITNINEIDLYSSAPEISIEMNKSERVKHIKYSRDNNNRKSEVEEMEEDEEEKDGKNETTDIKIKKLLTLLETFILHFMKMNYDKVYAKYLDIDASCITFDLIKKFDDELKKDKTLLNDLALDRAQFYPKYKTYKKIRDGSVSPRHKTLTNNIFLKKIMELRPIFDGIVKDDFFVSNFIFFQPMGEFIRENIKNHLKNIEISKKVLNFNSPEQFFPLARKMKRNFIYHMGPTNSGKTTNALKRLAQAKSGMYCAPLRLLAWEIREKLTKEGVKCTLLTGQDRVYTDGQTHFSMTIEKADLRKKFDIAVIDEIQMIEDDERGSAWTNAVLGIQADEIHLCGDERGFHLIKQLCDKTGDSLSYKRYNRFSNLLVEDYTFDYSDVRPGDCIISFSKTKIMEIKKRIVEVKNDPNSCAVIYGDLPSDTKKDQANLFNEINVKENIKYDYLVASDAVRL